MEETKQLNSESNTATPYDDVHRTMINDCPKLIIPVVNEMFHKKHSDNEKIIVLNNEFFINRQGGIQTERVTDTHFLIGSDRYHLECQSSTDGTIMYRIFEYDSQIAMQDSSLSKDKLVVKFPNTAVLYLRHNKNTPDFMTLEIRVPGAACSYRVPVMKVQKYSVDEIFEKRLFFLIPFHIFAYEKDFKEYDTDEQRMEELTKVYEEIVEKLEAYTKEQVIDGYTKETIIDMSKKVLEHLAKKYSKVREGVGAIMGGKILDYPAKQLLNQGRAEGRAEERRQMLIEILEEKGTLSEQLQKMIQEEVDLEVLKKWSKMALKAESLVQFEEEIVGR